VRASSGSHTAHTPSGRYTTPIQCRERSRILTIGTALITPQLYKPVLEQFFAASPNPGAEERDFLAKKTGMSRKQIDVWVRCLTSRSLQNLTNAQFVNKRMRTAKYERAQPLAPNVTFIHYDVPRPDLDSMVDRLGGIAYARGASVLSQASDDYLLVEPESEHEDYGLSEDDDEESPAGTGQERLEEDADARDAASDFETVYWSTEEDVVSDASLTPLKWSLTSPAV
jgi:hypothetical protein